MTLSACMSSTNTFLLVLGFSPKLGFLADFLYTYIITGIGSYMYRFLYISDLPGGNHIENA
jgi:hypothetical protein